jgi:hypothetical protein
VSARSLAFGSAEERKRAVAGRLKEALCHFPALEEVLVEAGFQPPQQLVALLQQLSASQC